MAWLATTLTTTAKTDALKAKPTRFELSLKPAGNLLRALNVITKSSPLEI